MSNSGKTIGNLVFSDIDGNKYLHRLYTTLLTCYGQSRFGLPVPKPFSDHDFMSLLRFADLLSKSTHPQKREAHKVWAQEIIILCQALFPNNEWVEVYADSVFRAVANYPAINHLGTGFYRGILDEVYDVYQEEYLRVPGSEGLKFFIPQKKAFDQFDEEAFSFSAPTSLGKSLLIHSFIKAKVRNEAKQNFCILVPTKALINETRSKFINDLREDLEEYNYRVVSTAGDIVLEGDHSFIFVLTPERLLYLLMLKPDLRLDYLFVDEGHKVASYDARAPFYYQVINLLNQRSDKPRFIFTAPNIPNPEVFLRLVNPETTRRKALATKYSPVTQIKFLIDINQGCCSIYNEHAEEFIPVAAFDNKIDTVETTIDWFTFGVNPDKPAQTLVFHSAKQKAIDNATKYSQNRPLLNDKDLDELANDISQEIHSEYYLAELIQKGIAYHVGYLPPTIRERIEELFRDGKIHVIFCTSTLLEGVNLPADNLIITNPKLGRSAMTAIDFKNLTGRVGRIRYNLYGNVFLLTGSDYAEKDKVEKLLKSPIEEQELAIDPVSKGLPDNLKRRIIATLSKGEVHFERSKNETIEQHRMARKFTLILLRDITQNRTSLVRREFEHLLTQSIEQKIIDAFAKKWEATQDDDINISVDQVDSLTAAIKKGLTYPEPTANGRFDYEKTLAFLNKLKDVFKWETYETKTLGAKGKNGKPPLRWYAVLLIQWMEGHGLQYIMMRAIEYRKENPGTFKINNQQINYANTIDHKNVVFADTLQAIESVILFSLSNYFLRFSNEYKKIHNIDHFENDWYEYVEYGTTNQTTITLQRLGFTRESATWIRENEADVITYGNDQNIPTLKQRLLESPNINVRREANEIYYNVPEAFEKRHHETQIEANTQQTTPKKHGGRPRRRRGRGRGRNKPFNAND